MNTNFSNFSSNTVAPVTVQKSLPNPLSVGEKKYI